MRKSVMIFGSISALAAILFAAAFATMVWQRSALDKTGKTRSATVASAVATQPDPDGLIAVQGPERLGSLSPSARYLAWLRVERGQAAFRVLVMQRDGRWLVHGYHVEGAQKFAAE